MPRLYDARTRHAYRAVVRLVPRAERPLVRRLVNAVDDAASARMLRSEGHVWQRTLDHLPGLAVALQLVRRHVEHDTTPCPVCAQEHAS